MTPYSLPETSRWRRAALKCRPTVRYCMGTEAHVFALAIAASVLLAFYPFMMVMLSFCRYVLHWRDLEVIYVALNDYFPGALGDFLKRNLILKGKIELTSMFLLLFTANGIFEPLEVALNKVWGVTANRSYVKNQLVSLGLIFLCGSLALLSLIFTAANRDWISSLTGEHVKAALWMNVLFFKIAAIPLAILGLFFVYWLLPNRKIAPRQVLPAAIWVALALEALKYLNLALWPILRAKLDREYGVFQNSVNIILWSFVASMIVLAGAEWCARDQQGPPGFGELAKPA